MWMESIYNDKLGKRLKIKHKIPTKKIREKENTNPKKIRTNQATPQLVINHHRPQVAAQKKPKKLPPYSLTFITIFYEVLPLK